MLHHLIFFLLDVNFYKSTVRFDFLLIFYKLAKFQNDPHTQGLTLFP